MHTKIIVLVITYGLCVRECECMCVRVLVCVFVLLGNIFTASSSDLLNFVGYCVVLDTLRIR